MPCMSVHTVCSVLVGVLAPRKPRTLGVRGGRFGAVGSGRVYLPVPQPGRAQGQYGPCWPKSPSVPGLAAQMAHWQSGV